MPEEPDRTAQPELGAQTFDLGPERTVADEVELGAGNVRPDLGERAQGEVGALRRRQASDHHDAGGNRSARQLEPLELDAVGYHPVLLWATDAGLQARGTLRGGERDERMAPSRGQALQSDVETRFRAVGRPERPTVRREHAGRGSPPGRRGETAEKTSFCRVDVDDVRSADEPEKGQPGAQVGRRGPPVRPNCVELDAETAVESAPDGRTARASDIDREALPRERAHEIDDVVRHAAAERLGCDQKPAWWMHLTKGIVRSPRTGG